MLQSYGAAWADDDGFTNFEVQKVFGAVEIPASAGPAKGPFAAAFTAKGGYLRISGKVPTRALVTRSKAALKWAGAQAAELCNTARKVATAVGLATAIHFAYGATGGTPPTAPQPDGQKAAPLVGSVSPFVLQSQQSSAGGSVSR